MGWGEKIDRGDGAENRDLTAVPGRVLAVARACYTYHGDRSPYELLQRFGPETIKHRLIFLDDTLSAPVVLFPLRTYAYRVWPIS